MIISNPDSAAFPSLDSQGYLLESGLTKRELFAALVLQGLLANPNRMEFPQDPYAVQAVYFADRLIEQLNQGAESKE